MGWLVIPKSIYCETHKPTKACCYFAALPVVIVPLLVAEYHNSVGKKKDDLSEAICRTVEQSTKVRLSVQTGTLPDYHQGLAKIDS